MPHMMPIEFLLCMVFINTYQFCHKLLLYAHSFVLFILLLSNKLFILTLDILDSLLTKKPKYAYMHTDTLPCHRYVYLCMCVLKKINSFTAKQKYIVACTGSTRRKYSCSDILQKEKTNSRGTDPQQRRPSWQLSPADPLCCGTTWKQLPESSGCRSFKVRRQCNHCHQFL